MSGPEPYFIAALFAAIAALFGWGVKVQQSRIDDQKELLKTMTDSMKRSADTQEITNDMFKALIENTLWQTVYDAVLTASQDAASGVSPRPSRRPRGKPSAGSTGAPPP